ncbi:MAG: PAS domain-containing protein [Nitrospiraceae bacterium]|nr:PAS domain-containing protein [Nitrospiraceae bacterium]
MTDRDKPTKKPVDEVEQLHRRIKELENELKDKRDSEERYKWVVFASQDAIILFDITTRRIIDVNKAAEKMYGYSREEFLKLTHNDITAEQEASDGSIKAVESEQSLRIPLRYHKRKDGTVFPVEISGSFIPYFTGQKVACGIIRDITERTQAMKKLMESELTYRTLIENLQQKIFLKDRHSVYISCNRKYADDLKINPDEIAGKSDYDFFPRELAEKYRQDDKRLIDLGKTEEIEETYIQDGREYWVHTVKKPIMDATGDITGILGIFWDITAQRQCENERRNNENK